MGVKLYQESSLGTSEIFKEINKTDGAENTLTKATNLIKVAKHLTVEDIEAAYISVRQVTDTLTRASIKAFDSEKVVLIYNDSNAQTVTKALPFITFKMKNGKYATYVFMKQYITIGRNGILNLQPSILRDLLISATVANGIRSDYSRLAGNIVLRNAMTDMYTEFMIRILNREFAIKSDRNTFETLQYWIRKFFMTRIFGTSDNPVNVENAAKVNIKNMDSIRLEEIARQYDEANPAVMSELVELLKTASNRMKGLNLAKFYSDWINYYGIPSMLALDNVEYLIFMIVSLQSGNNVISIAASDVVKECKGIKGFREELLKLI